jgi:transcriptional regulator with GAF, ATPase, and Fis domain
MQQPPALIGDSAATRELRSQVQYAAQSDAKVMITGESGVGKEVACQQLHGQSRRSRGPLITINCGGLTDSLLESELFGHVKGSFTGAYRDKPGKLELASNGTVFLDEVGEMSLRMQAMLLRFLETGEIQRVGSHRANAHVDVRVLAATNRNLLERVAAREFREDLYYRLNVIHISVPPLRERREDIAPLVKHFLEMFSRIHRVATPELSAETMTRLQKHDWPGNVRELKNVIERMVLRWDPTLLTSRLPFDGVPAPASPASTLTPAARAAALHQRMLTTGESFWSVVFEPFMLHDLTRDDLRALLQMGLDETRGSYKILVGLYNMEPEHYKRFMGFLRKYGCHVPFQSFRLASSNPGAQPATRRHAEVPAIGRGSQRSEETRVAS